MVVGIIPACAGETPHTTAAQARPADHPRLRGGNSPPMSLPPTIRGSSPLARGKRRLDEGLGDADRIIPACAGETTPPRNFAVMERDHPRLRGGNLRGSLG